MPFELIINERSIYSINIEKLKTFCRILLPRATKSNMFITLLLLYCRLATVLLYLNEPEKGGETAFPLADNETFSTEVWTKINDY